MSESSEWVVRVGDHATRAVFEPAGEGRARVLFVMAHGAGGHMGDRAMVAAAKTIRGRGIDVLRFNFLYRERGSGRPDRMPLLEECTAAVVARARDELNPERLVIGGRSMGGRAASMLAARGFACDGLLLLAYPLHPAGRPDQLRVEHLPDLRVPVLCLNGTRDDLCRRELMEEALTRVRTDWTMHWLEAADHSFHVLKSSGRTDGQVLDEVGSAVAAWAARLG